MEIEQTNLELGRAVITYLASKDRKVVEEQIMADTTTRSEKVGVMLKSLTEFVHSNVEGICRVWRPV